MSTTTTSKPRIAIIGSGLTGLLVAQGLRKNGIEATVYERDAAHDVRPRDWSILIHWGLKIIEDLVPEPVWAKVKSASYTTPHLKFEGGPEETLPIYNGATGDVLFSMPHPGARRVSRQRLRQVLLDGGDGGRGIDVQWGKRLVNLAYEDRDGTTRLTFEDGSEAVADLVVGADGASSKVRELLVGPEMAEVNRSGMTWATGLVKYGDADKVEAVCKLHPVAAIIFMPAAVGGCGVLTADDPEDKAAWTTFWVKIWRGGQTNLHGKECLDYIKETTQGSFEPYQKMIDWTDDTAQCDADEMKYWVPSSYDNHGGKVTLIGDAAHAMLPYRGQGLQHSINDADNYIKTILEMGDSFTDAAKRKDIMTAFDEEVIARGAKAVTESLSEAEKSLNPDALSTMLMVKKGLQK